MEGNEDGQAGAAFEDLFEKLKMLQEEYDKLETMKKAGMPSPPSEIPSDVRQMLKLQNAALTVQKWWRNNSSSQEKRQIQI